MMTTQGCKRRGSEPCMSDGIDQKSGTINVYILCPEPGDSVQVINMGTHYEVHHAHWEQQPLYLTTEDIEFLKAGKITWH